MRGHTAAEITDALATARSVARITRTPRHIIARAGRLEVVATICDSDDVVVRDVMPPRHTGAMIGAETEASMEISQAMPHITRAVEIVKARGFSADAAPIEAEEVLSDLIENAANAASIIRDGRSGVPRKRSPWARFIPRMA